MTARSEPWAIPELDPEIHAEAEHGTLWARVMGPPCVYGNKTPGVNRKTGKMFVREQTRSGSRNVRVWQDALRESMLASIGGDRFPEGFKLLEGPVVIAITFFLARPKTHRRKDGGLSKQGLASIAPTKKPDCDKVARAVADAAKGIWYVDDAQIVDERIRKRWSELGVESTMVYVMEVPPR